MFTKSISGVFSCFMLLFAISVGGCASDDMHDDGMMKQDKMMKDDSMMKDDGMMKEDKMKDDEMMKDSM